MLAHLRLLLSVLSFMAFTTNPDPGQNPDDEDPEGDKKKPKPEFTDEQNAEISRIVAREVRKAKEAGRKERDQELEAEREASEAEAKRKADEEAGKFEEVKQSLIDERDAAKAELESITKERDELQKLVQADVEAQWGELPEEIRAAFDGDEEDALAKKQHMQRMQPITDKLIAKARGGGNPRNPDAADDQRERAESPLTVSDILNL